MPRDLRATALTPDLLLALQGRAGNAAVSRLVAQTAVLQREGKRSGEAGSGSRDAGEAVLLMEGEGSGEARSTPPPRPRRRGGKERQRTSADIERDGEEASPESERLSIRRVLRDPTRADEVVVTYAMNRGLREVVEAEVAGASSEVLERVLHTATVSSFASPALVTLVYRLLYGVQIAAFDASIKGLFDAHVKASMGKIQAGGRDWRVVGRGQIDALVELSRTPSAGAWTMIAWSDVAPGAAERVLRPSRIDQGVLNACGPAAALHAAAERSAGDYADLVRSVFIAGAIFGKRVGSSARRSKPPGGMAAVDWMVLTALRKFDRAYFSSGMKSHLKQLGGCVEVKEFSCMHWGEEKAAKRASDLLQGHGDDVVVVMGIQTARLKGFGREDGEVGARADTQEAGRPQTTDHWIRLLTPIRRSSDTVAFRAFTWGKELEYEMTPKQFKRAVYTFVVGAHKDDIEL